MIFESEYRRGALNRWQASRDETERELKQELRSHRQRLTRLYTRVQSKWLSLLQ